MSHWKPWYKRTASSASELAGTFKPSSYCRSNRDVVKDAYRVHPQRWQAPFISGLFDACHRLQECDVASARVGRRRISPMEKTAECPNAFWGFAAMAIDRPGWSVVSNALWVPTLSAPVAGRARACL